ncbi:MAG: exonuclease domain-containing protein [Leptolyngbya sp. BL-A-14]
MREDWVILDTETTGLRNAEIIQIGVLSGGGEVLLDSLVKPTIPIPHKTSIIHGISDDQVQNAPTFPEIYPHFVDLIKNKAVVIYNAQFDEAIFRYCCNRAHFNVPGFTELHCAMQWYAKWIGDWSDYHGNYRWPKLPGGDHSAIGDCHATLKVIQMMSNSFVPESKADGNAPSSQRSSIIIPDQQITFSELQSLVKDGIQPYPNQDDQATATNHELEPLLAHTNREVIEDLSTLDISNDGRPTKKNSFIQENNLFEDILKEDVIREDQQISEDLDYCQPDKSSEYINSQQIQTYIRARELGLTQAKSAYISGFSERTGQRIESGNYRPNRERVRDWRTRPDPLSDVWEYELIPLLQEQPQLNSVQLLEYLQQRYPGKYNTSLLRTFQRRVYDWRARQGLLQTLQPNRSSQNRDTLEQLEWMQRVQNGKIQYEELEIILADKLELKDIHFLINHILNSPLNYRERALTVLFYLHKVPRYLISRFLMLSPRTVRRYIEKHEVYGVRKLLDFSRRKIKKREDPRFIEKVFEILHAPPSSYAINRTSWTMKDLHRIMAETGFGIAPSNIRQIIRDAGYKFRNAKKVLTSTDPNYREKLQKITQILSNLGPKDKFFSIDEFGPFSVKIQGGRSLMPPGEVRVVP